MNPTGSARLSPQLLPHLPGSIRRPGYDRNKLQIGMAHIGVGAFHRCHQADYTDDMLSAAFDRWGVVGINVREPLLGDTLGVQEGLYTRLLKTDERTESRVIGCIRSTLDAQAHPGECVRLLAAPEIDVITLTVTEKGYCHTPATGALDRENGDIVHDVENPATPRSVPGILVRALDLRMRMHGRPVTLISCDNIPSNGTVLKGVVEGVADTLPPELKRWISSNVAFPSTMVDRIVPATTIEDIESLERSAGYRDSALVVGEPFRQWVIESQFAARAPRWDLAGAAFVDDVAPFELLKMRVLNAAQTAAAYLGALAGYEFSSASIRDRTFAAFVRRMLVEESAPTVPAIPSAPIAEYVDETFRRIENTAVRHLNHQIASDGSQKIVQRILNPIRERLAKGQSVELLSVVVAAWMAYVLGASSTFGRRWEAVDPMSSKFVSIADRCGRNPRALVDDFFSIRSIFAEDLAKNLEFTNAVTRHLTELLAVSPAVHLKSILKEQRVEASRGQR